MGILYHASAAADIEILEPRISNHGISRVYFSRKRENVLVYLSNAIEKYCRETGFEYHGIWKKWGPYGFTREGILRIEEYYPDALKDTYSGVSAYIYQAEEAEDMTELSGIKDAVIAERPVPVKACERIPDAYDEIIRAYRDGKIDILKFEDMTSKMREWNQKMVRQEYENATEHPEYRHFLEGKFGYRK